jgi:hypothetical protein
MDRDLPRELETASDPDRGRQYEQLGFTFCRVGSICLLALAPAYALLIASGLTIFYYLRAMQAGVTRSDCFLRHPLVIIAFWFCVGAGDMAYLIAHHLK